MAPHGGTPPHAVPPRLRPRRRPSRRSIRRSRHQPRHLRRPEARQLGWVRRLARVVRPELANIRVAIAAAVLSAAVGSCVPLIERHILDRVILRGSSPLAPWLAVLLATCLATFVLARTRRLRSATVVLELQSRLRDDIHDRVQRLDASVREVIPSGQLVARANSDVNRLVKMLSPVPAMTAYAVTIVASLVLILALAPLLALVQFLVVPGIVLVAFRMRARVVPASWDSQQRAGELAQRVHQAVAGVSVVKGYAQEEREVERMVDVATQLYGSRLRAIRLQARFRPLLFAVPALGQVAVLTVGGWMALRGGFSAGTFLACSTYAITVAVPTWLVGSTLAALPQLRSSAERIFDLIDTTSPISDAPRATALQVTRGEVRFDNVSFGYPGMGWAVSDLQLRIAPGETVALVGTSASGKSTVAMLLARFRDPAAGAVFIDDIDLRAATLSSLRSQIGIVFQDTFLFAGTIRDNISFGRPDASAAQVEAAARTAQAHDFIAGLPLGYDTIVGERGLTLSGGQRQRLALARAVLTDPPILVLDDATSAVDAQVEWSIHEALRHVLRGRTVLLVAHRRATLALADRIVVMAHGRVVDNGTHAQLVQRCALYRALLAGAAQGGLLRPARVPVGASAGVPVGTDVAPASGAPPSVPRMIRRSDEMLERLASLPPVRDKPGLTHALRPGEDERRFSMWRSVRPYRWSLLLGVVLVAINAAAVAAGPYLSRQAVDVVVLGGSGRSLLPLSGLYLLVTAISCAVAGAVSLVTGRTGEQLVFDLRIRIWRHLQRLPMSFYERESGGAVMTRMTADVDAFSSLFQDGIVNAAVSTTACTAIVIAMVALSPLLTLATLGVVVPPLVAATVLFRRLSARPYQETRVAMAAINTGLQESLAGARESQAFGQVERRHGEFRRLTRRYLETRLAAQRLITLYFPFIDLLAGIATAVVLAVGCLLVRHDLLSVGGVVAFLLYAGLFFSPMQQLSDIVDDWQEAQVSKQKITELMLIEPSTAQPTGPAPRRPAGPSTAPATRRPAEPTAKWPAEPTARPPAEPELAPPPRWGLLPASISFDQVRFRYPESPGGSEALRGVDLAIAPGEIMALVGGTGAGKSTLLKLLVRAYQPTGGRILINGRPLHEWNPDHYHSRVGYVPQDPFLFVDTVRANIAYGRPGATPSEVEAAARATTAHEVIARLPGGYDCRVGERGGSLSAGQRQLICLARAELLDPAILLLDEATASLDPLSDAAVTTAMRMMAGRRTTVLVAHRLKTAQLADRIAVVLDGRIVEAGSHDELLSRGGHYAQLWAYATVR